MIGRFIETGAIVFLWSLLFGALVPVVFSYGVVLAEGKGASRKVLGRGLIALAGASVVLGVLLIVFSGLGIKF